MRTDAKPLRKEGMFTDVLTLAHSVPLCTKFSVARNQFGSDRSGRFRAPLPATIALEWFESVRLFLFRKAHADGWTLEKVDSLGTSSSSGETPGAIDGRKRERGSISLIFVLASASLRLSPFGSIAH